MASESELTSGYICALLQVESLWELLCPLLRTALSNITVETYADWGTCIATACVSFCSFVSIMSVYVHIRDGHFQVEVLLDSRSALFDNYSEVSHPPRHTHTHSQTNCISLPGFQQYAAPALL